MKVYAIIAEYNPLHTGHLYHIRRTLEESDRLVIIMSGSFTQRGDIAIDDKYNRAISAVRAGADMVIEMPTIYAISPADKFAYGAIKTLGAMPVNYLSFGSESGSVDKLKRASDVINNETQQIKTLIRQKLDEGYPLVKARSYAFEQFGLDNNFSFTPNNTLAIEYLRAIDKLQLDIKPFTIQRQGNDYNDMSSEGQYLSATAIRESIYKGDYDKVSQYLPYPINYNASSQDILHRLILYKLNTMSKCDLNQTFDVSEGLENRIINCLCKTDYNDFIQELKTKRYTMARIKRILLCALLGITYTSHKNAYNASPYINVLAIKEDSRDLLSTTTKNIITKPSDISHIDTDVRPLVELDYLSYRLHCIINGNKSNINSMQVISK